MIAEATTTSRPSSACAAPAMVMCAHCGDRVPPGLIDEEAVEQFCCAGCRTVFQVIHETGLERYYALRRETEASSVPAQVAPRRFGEFDDPSFHRLYVLSAGPDLATVELFLPAAHCAACVWLIEKLPKVCPGVVEARLDLRRALVRIIWNQWQVDLSAIARALNSLGYAPTPAREARMRQARRMEDRRRLISLGVAGACAGNVMLLALALYSGLFDEMEPRFLHLFRWVSMAISLVSLAWPGSVFFTGAWRAMRTRTLHLDLPIALGLGAGAAWGIASTWRGTGEIYFDSLSVLVFALLLGRFVQTRQQRWSADAVELLFSLTPTSARVVDDESQNDVRDVPIEAVQPGMIVDVLPGDSIPVDGVAVRGASKIDQSLLTGESRPLDVRPGLGVTAGAINLISPIRVRVEAAGELTRVGRLMRMVEQASQRRAPIVRMADRLAGCFVAAMLVLAAITVAIWLVIEPSRSLDNAAALLIVTCPCALGLATPLAMTVSIGRAARRGILIKGGDVLQSLARRGIVFLDKTGTVTHGRLGLVEWIGDEAIKPIIRAVERHSTHPIARALVETIDDEAAGPVEGVRQTIGGGVEATVCGHEVIVGSPRFVRGRCDGSAIDDRQAELRMLASALTPVLMAIDRRVVAIAGFGDPVRTDAAESIAAMKRLGWTVRLLSGDHDEIARAVGRRVGLGPEECRGGASPEAKLQSIRDALGQRDAGGRRTPVVMVGDGVNDAAALAAADVGIAAHGGAEASLAAADIYLHQPGLSPIIDLISASQRTMRVIRRNLCASLFYNALAATLALTGVINPLIAAILMPVSSLSVVAISVRSRSFSPGRDETTPGQGGR